MLHVVWQHVWNDRMQKINIWDIRTYVYDNFLLVTSNQNVYTQCNVYCDNVYRDSTMDSMDKNTNQNVLCYNSEQLYNLRGQWDMLDQKTCQQIKHLGIKKKVQRNQRWQKDC